MCVAMRIKKGMKVFVNRKIDMTSTGGPVIPEFAHATVLKTCLDGTAWVEFSDSTTRKECGRRKLSIDDLQA